MTNEVAFGVMVVVVLLDYAVVWRMLHRLRTLHEDLWIQVGSPSLSSVIYWMGAGLRFNGFAWSSRPATLGDSRLVLHAWAHRLLCLAAIGIFIDAWFF
ncbi:MAG: hypothetical protein K8F56_04600 [Rhodocyclaceae bacterium]|nr:hypothetical protein [Rhodocyclaceae bacterium]